MIKTLFENVMMPIAGLILAFVMTLELIQLITDKNNLYEVVCCKRCISSTSNTTHDGRLIYGEWYWLVRVVIIQR